MLEKGIKLSALVHQIEDAIDNEFGNEAYWVSAQIANVKKQEMQRRCYLTLEDYEEGAKTAEIRAVLWANFYTQIEQFEKNTGQEFKSGIEIVCKIRVRFHSVYGLNADIVEIDAAHTLGTLELLRQQTLEKLIKENPRTIQLYDGVYRTFNNRLPLPLVINRIALITAPNSDGQRDFIQEISTNRHAYSFKIDPFLITIQGDTAHELILEQLHNIEREYEKYDAVAIVRGGGSSSDFKPFENYELALTVAHFPLPIISGIGHDRNQSIVDMMAREQKTPTKAAAFFVDHNFEFENSLLNLKSSIYNSIKNQLQQANQQLTNAKKFIKMVSPQTILDRGFAIISLNNTIITNPTLITADSEISTQLGDATITSTVTKNETHGTI
jgi:exodeoxyribonuclease VII large subunit